MLVHLKQANLLFLDFNAITAPLMYIKDQLASRTTLDQHCVALIVMRLVRKMWKVLSSNCDVYMGYFHVGCFDAGLPVVVWWKLPL